MQRALQSSSANAVGQAAGQPAPGLTRDKVLLLAIGLGGSFLVGLSGQFPNVGIAAVQAGLGASADAASWTATVYLMGALVGVVLATLTIQAFGLRRFLAFNAAVFAAAGVGGAVTTSLDLLVGLRAVQGVAAGGFGPAAFVALYMTMGGPRLARGAALLAFALTAPVVLSPVLSGVIEAGFGWRGLFVAQAAVGGAVAAAAQAWLPRAPIAWARLKADWTAVALLATGLAAAALVLSQGTRRGWFEDGVVLGAAVVGVAALAGFVVALTRSSRPLIDPRLMLRREFGVTIGAYTTFRFGLIAAAVLVPQVLTVVQGRRPLEIAGLMAWAAAAQALAAPIVWRLMHRLDSRVLMGLGLALSAGSAWLLGAGALAAAEQIRLALVLLGVGSMLFMLPALVVGTRSLTPPDLPTASLVFNVATYGAGALASAVFASLTAAREILHAGVLAEVVSLHQAQEADRLAALAAGVARGLVDDGAGGGAVSALMSWARREAWGLAFSDSFAVLAVVLALGVAVVLLMVRCPPLTRAAPERPALADAPGVDK